MNLINLPHFSRLRLKSLLGEKDYDRSWSFEYLGKLWFGDTYGFSHAMRLFTNPFKTQSIAINFGKISDSEISNISKIIGINLTRSLTKEECFKAYGSPAKVEEFVDDRKTYAFFMGSRPDYEVGFTILNAGGLLYFTMETYAISNNE
jgi:hypothetical protein